MTGLVGHWPMNERSGQANDLSGEGNHGTVNSVDQGAWGRGGLTSYDFGGTVNAGDDSALDITDQTTWSVWLRPNGNQDSSSRAFEKNANSGYGVQLSSGGSIYINKGGSWNWWSAGSIPNNEWTHMVFVFDNNEGYAHFYINGELTKTRSTSSDFSNTSGSSLIIGDQSGSSRPYRGYMADLRIYERPLSHQEVQTLYEWGSADYTPQSLHDGTDSGAVSRYEFSSGSVTADSWGGNTLTDNTSAGTTTNAIKGDAKSFDGADDYMQASDDSSITFGTTDFCISAWFRLDTLDNNSGIVTKRESTSPYHGFTLKANSDGGLRFVIDGTNGGGTSGSSSVSTGSWYHIVGQRNTVTDNSELWLNGVLDDTGPMASDSDASNTEPMLIGDGNPSSGQLDGDIDDVRIYNRHLSAFEIHQLYRWGAPGRDMRKQVVKA